MKKKDFIFIFGLTLLMGIVWIVGELVMGLWLPVLPWVYIAWRIGIVAVTLIISVWHAFIEDESGKKDPRTEKYERKIQKRKK